MYIELSIFVAASVKYWLVSSEFFIASGEVIAGFELEVFLFSSKIVAFLILIRQSDDLLNSKCFDSFDE